VAIALIASLVLAGLSRGPFGGLRRSSPTATASSTRPPPSSTPKERNPMSVQDALNNLALILTEGVSNGDISRHAANEIGKDVDQALRNYQKGDLEKALEDLNELGAKVEEMESKRRDRSGPTDADPPGDLRPEGGDASNTALGRRR
jgi:hypothetical protein